MSKQHPHPGHAHKGEHVSPKQGIHHKWWFWVAVVLMLAGMFMYVASQDESILPGGQVAPPVPADAE